MPLARPSVVIGLDLVHDSDLGVQAFARHVGEHLPVDRARLVVAGMRGVLEGRPELTAEASAAFPDADLRTVTSGPDLVAVLAAAAGLTEDAVTDARVAAAHDLARSAWTIGPAPGLAELRRVLAAHDRQLAVMAPGPVGVPEILDAIEMPDVPWVVVPAGQQEQWWREAVRPPTAAELRTAETDPGHRRGASPAPTDHLAIADRLADLHAPARTGAPTVLVDRFGLASASAAPALPRPTGDRWPTVDRVPTATAMDLTALLGWITSYWEGR